MGLTCLPAANGTTSSHTRGLQPLEYSFDVSVAQSQYIDYDSRQTFANKFSVIPLNVQKKTLSKNVVEQYNSVSICFETVGTVKNVPIATTPSRRDETWMASQKTVNNRVYELKQPSSSGRKKTPRRGLPDEVLKDFTLTAYALTKNSTGKSPGTPGFGITASGTKATVSRTVAVDPRIIPIGTRIYIEGIGWRVAEDTGFAIKGKHIDILLPSDEIAWKFGVRRHISVHLPR